MSVAQAEVGMGEHDPFLLAASREAEDRAISKEAKQLVEDLEAYLATAAGIGAVSVAETVQDRPMAVEAATINPNVEARVQRTITALRLGRLSLSETCEGKPAYNNSKEMFLASLRGDVVALEGVLTNFETLFGEWFSPVQSVIHSEAKVIDGVIWQYGSSALSIAHNTFRVEGTTTSTTESINNLRVGLLVASGDMQPGDTHVEWSPVTEDERAKLEALGYFVSSMTLIGRTMTLRADGMTLDIDSHLVAGADFKTIDAVFGAKTTPEAIQERQEAAIKSRFDKQVLRELLGEEYGIDVGSNPDANAILSKSYLVRGEPGENVGLEMIKKLDARIARLLGGDDVVYGVRNSEKTYGQIQAESRASKEAMRQKAEQLYERVAAELATSPDLSFEEFPALYAKVAKQMLVDAVVYDGVSELLLGSGGAQHAIWARQDIANGGDGGNHIKAAVENATPGGCPPGQRRGNEQGADKNSADIDKDCDFMSKECPVCKKKNVKTNVSTVKKGGMKVKTIKGDCGCIKVVISGK